MAKPTYPSAKLDQYIVRFPDGMRDRLKAEAAANKRSLNAEIISRLENTLHRDDFEQEQRNMEPLIEEDDVSPVAKAVVEAYEKSQRLFRHELRALGFISSSDPDALERLEALSKPKANKPKDAE